MQAGPTSVRTCELVARRWGADRNRRHLHGVVSRADVGAPKRLTDPRRSADLAAPDEQLQSSIRPPAGGEGGRLWRPPAGPAPALPAPLDPLEPDLAEHRTITHLRTYVWAMPLAAPPTRCSSWPGARVRRAVDLAAQIRQLCVLSRARPTPAIGRGRFQTYRHRTKRSTLPCGSCHCAWRHLRCGQ